MKLFDYLFEKEIHPLDFAKTVGLQATTIHRIVAGMSPHLVNARKIVEATDGLVSYDDLIPEVKRKKTRRKRNDRKKLARSGD